jgi:AAA family ATP:ADP antiporter
MTTLRNPASTDLRSRLRALLGVEIGEGTTVTSMVALYFVISISFVLVQTTAFGLFVNEFGSQSLPFAYLSVAVLASLIAFLYLKLSDRLPFKAAQFTNLGFLAGMCLVFWIGLRSSLAHWVIFLLPFWFQALVNQSNLIVWHLAGHLFNVRQAKRLYGLIGAGNWLANIIGGAVVAGILALTGTANAYFLAALALAIAVPVLFSAMRSLHTVSPQSAAPRPAAASGTATSPFRQPYSRLIFAYTLLWWLGFCFIDNIFFDRAGIEFPSGTELASFIARQLSVMGVIAIITSMFLTSRIVRRYGLRTGLLAMPLVVTLSILLLAVGGSLGWTAPTLFWIATVAKTFNVALGFSISQVTGSLLFQPLFGRQRNAAQTISEGIVQPVAMGLAGVILLLFNTILHFNAVGLSYLFLVIAVLWFWAMIRLSQEYPLVMSEALLKRSLGETTSLIFDPSALAQLRRSLRNPRAGLAIYALNQLEQLAPQTWAATLREELPALLLHRAPEVRREALLRILALRLTAAVPDVRRRLPLEQDAQVRAAIIQVLAALGDRASAPHISEALDSPERAVRRGAILGLLASGSADDARRAEETLGRHVRSSDSMDRLLAVEILGESSVPGASGQLIGLLDDDDVAVRRSAVRSAGRHDDDRLIPALLQACDSPDTALVAEQVLISKGSQVLGPIADEFGANGQSPIPGGRLQSMIRVLGRIPGARSIELLAGKISIADPQVRLQVLRSLSAIGYRAGSSAQILAQVKQEVVLACRLSAAIQTVRDSSDELHLSVLEGALKIAFREARQRTLLLLSFVFHAQAILRAHSALEAIAGGPSPIALETVDALLPAGVKPLVLPLLEEIPHGDRVKRWQAAGLGIAPQTLSAVLLSLIGTELETQFDPWTRMCAMHAAAILDEKSCAPSLQRLLTTTQPAVRAMTSWSLARLSRDRIAQGDGNMLSLVEKVLILKSSPLFSETPDNVLADIADLVDEIAVEKDQVIFNRGEPGDSLYIIVSGKVQVWEGDRLLNSLGEGDLFGELALLDPEPRLATVKTTESTRVLRLDQTHFHEVLGVRPEVSSAIIRVVTRYLRSQLKYAREVNEKLRSLESFGALSNPSRD